jgi:hypothetical protein
MNQSQTQVRSNLKNAATAHRGIFFWVPLTLPLIPG